MTILQSGAEQKTPHPAWLATTIFTLVLLGVLPLCARAQNSKVTVVTSGATYQSGSGPVVTLSGSDAINPTNGSMPFSPGPGAQGFNNEKFKNTSTPYVIPGQGQDAEAGDDKNAHALPNDPFFIAYDNPSAFPVQSNDWWPAVGLQLYVPSTKSGWAGAYPNFTRAEPFTSEPFRFDFVDYNNTGAPTTTQKMHGLRIWSQNQFWINTTGSS